ncbi:MAG: M48 family metalloprotease [Candidatus Kapaibacterium sp.]
MNVEVSTGFKQMTTRAIVAIVMFIITYLLLILFSIALMIVCVYGGLALIAARPMLITIIGGVGMASVGIFIMLFLVKFLFKKHTKDVGSFTEISIKTEPRLIGLIGDIVREVETDFPHKIYLSADVNASVFYDSSFWSMFLPVKKNLQIGLGLVNSVTEDEFKAILAHEFGHFSQRTMKVGSYVYNVNQVIYNMLYDNDEFEVLLYKWAEEHGAISVFVAIGLHIIKGIQWILKQLYEAINIRYMALSREMEFHADAVAAHVAGCAPLKDSLLRLQFADYAYSSVLDFYNGKIHENITSANIYAEHSFVMNFLAERNEIPLRHGLPAVRESDGTKYKTTKLSFLQQWASHPSTEDRIHALEQLNITKESTGHRPAIELFSNPERLQEKLTFLLFSKVSYTAAPSKYDIDTFKNQYTNVLRNNSFDDFYNGYYDHKIPIAFDPSSVLDPTSACLRPEECFTKEKVDMVYELIALDNDRVTLKNITDTPSDIRTFDYDGRKYSSDSAQKLIVTMNTRREELHHLIAWHDIEIYRCFSKLAERVGRQEELQLAYMGFFLMDSVYDKKGERYSAFRRSLDFMSTTTPIEQIEYNFREIAVEEREIKEELQKMLTSELLNGEIPPATAENCRKYCDKEWVYFKDSAYDSEAIHVLMTALAEYAYLHARQYFFTKKKLLSLQLELLDRP